jgi:hypothetical protein
LSIRHFAPMSSPAQVRSTDSIEGLSLALARFQERVQNALDSLDADMRRTDDWIDHNRPAHWKKEIHEAENGVHQAKLDLERCLLMTTVDGQRPACREQKAALVKAKARLDYCREKADVVKKWQRSFRHDSMEFRGRVGQLRRVLEQDVPNARTTLEVILRRIEDYQLERAPEAFSAHGVAPAAAVEAHARTASPPPTPAPPATADAPPEPEAAE